MNKLKFKTILYIKFLFDYKKLKIDFENRSRCLVFAYYYIAITIENDMIETG